jgi:RNA polymerase sigma factor (sigma-70 family)
VKAPALDASDENLLRDLAPQVLGSIMRRYGDFAAGEDAVQEALIAAATQWPRDGVPENPRGWLIQVASRRMTDHIRSETSRRRRETRVFQETPPEESVIQAPDAITHEEADDALVLLFMCCHQALSEPSAIALTLRAVGGLTTAEIANAFLVPESTMAQRISRAKQSVKMSGVPFRMPSADEKGQRLGAVLHVLYLIFNEGYASSIGETLQRAELASEAIRLARTVHRLLPEDTETAGLLALMLLTDARRPARTGSSGELIPLKEQDRGIWVRPLIEEGVGLISRTLARGAVGPYQLQAAIAAVHDEAPNAGETDWPQILALYSVLLRMTDNPMVILNHAIADAMVNGPRSGLAKLEPLDDDERMRRHHRLDAVRGHLHEMLGDRETAVRHFKAAAERTASLPERNYLLALAARLTAD